MTYFLELSVIIIKFFLLFLEWRNNWRIWRGRNPSSLKSTRDKTEMKSRLSSMTRQQILTSISTRWEFQFSTFLIKLDSYCHLLVLSMKIYILYFFKLEDSCELIFVWYLRRSAWKYHFKLEQIISLIYAGIDRDLERGWKRYELWAGPIDNRRKWGSSRRGFTIYDFVRQLGNVYECFWIVFCSNGGSTFQAFRFCSFNRLTSPLGDPNLLSSQHYHT